MIVSLLVFRWSCHRHLVKWYKRVVDDSDRKVDLEWSKILQVPITHQLKLWCHLHLPLRNSFSLLRQLNAVIIYQSGILPVCSFDRMFTACDTCQHINFWLFLEERNSVVEKKSIFEQFLLVSIVFRWMLFATHDAWRNPSSEFMTNTPWRVIEHLVEREDPEKYTLILNIKIANKYKICHQGHSDKNWPFMLGFIFQKWFPVSRPMHSLRENHTWSLLSGVLERVFVSPMLSCPGSANAQPPILAFWWLHSPRWDQIRSGY